MMGLGPKKDGGPNAKYFEAPDTINLFDGIRTWLLKNAKKYVQTDPPTNKGLAALVIQLIQFQEDNLGKNVVKPPLTRLPMRCFLDFKPGGALCHILATVYKFKTDQGWRRFDFQSPSRMDRNVEMFMNVEKTLIANRCLVMPCVFIRPEVDKATAGRIRDVIKRHQGSITDVDEEATHIIYPASDPLEEEYARPALRRGDRSVLLHWYYFPDSHDTWLSPVSPPDLVPRLNETPSEARALAHTHAHSPVPAGGSSPGQGSGGATPLPPVYTLPANATATGLVTSGLKSGPWRVGATWVLDLDQYNEWMTEEDYEVDEAGKKKVHKLRLSVEDLMNPGDPMTPVTPASGGMGAGAGANAAERGKKKTKRKRSPSPPPPPPPTKGQPGKRKSGRGPAIASGKKHRGGEEEGGGGAAATGGGSNSNSGANDDLTHDLDDPSSEPNVQEVPVPKGGSSSSKKDNDLQPIKGGTLTDLEENDTMDRGEDTSAGKGSSEQGNQEGSSVGGRDGGGKDDGQEDTVTEQTHHIVVPSYSAWFEYNSIHTVERRALPEFFNGKNRSKTPEVYLAYRNFMIDTYRLNPTEYLTSTACRRNLAGDVCAVMRVHAFLEQWGLINYQEPGFIVQVDADGRPTPMGPPPTSHFHVLADTPSGLQPVNPPKTPQPSAAKALLDLDGAQRREGGAANATARPNDSSTTDISSSNFGLRLDQYARKPAALRNKTAANMTREWTDQETLLLLEGLEMHKDDWNKVCEHVGSRTQDECILHFLRLPIEDPYLEDAELGGGALGPLAYQPIPFSKAGNPIMSTVAFLASVVDPRVAAAAAKAAMEEFANIKDEVPAALVDAHVKNVEASAAEGKFDPSAGLAQSGIAGTAVEKEEEAEKEKTPAVKEEKDAGATTTAATATTTTTTTTTTPATTTTSTAKEGEGAAVTPASATTPAKEEAGGEQQKKEKKSGDEEEPMEVDGKEDSSSGAKEKAEAKEGAEKEGTGEEESETKEEAKEGAEKDAAPTKETPEDKTATEARLQGAAAAALASAAVKAKHLAAVEERKIKSLVALLVETQMKKLEIKLRHFEELETTMEREREGLEYQRQQLIAERQQFHLEQLKAAEFRARHQAHQRLMASEMPPSQPVGLGGPPPGGMPPTTQGTGPSHPGAQPPQQPPPPQQQPPPPAPQAQMQPQPPHPQQPTPMQPQPPSLQPPPPQAQQQTVPSPAPPQQQAPPPTQQSVPPPPQPPQQPPPPQAIPQQPPPVQQAPPVQPQQQPQGPPPQQQPPPPPPQQTPQQGPPPQGPMLGWQQGPPRQTPPEVGGPPGPPPVASPGPQSAPSPSSQPSPQRAV
ncbi:SWI/SNF complex subunit SMARCC1 isoform X2 [Ischnura elegans]|uniref:SWI/SNF complex subunit SMARCC1 isoform X2 n=1 Tax=Ischnura elegans TaxID=197161 RepID=UPI001ED88C50|nr:SWI/SNF complex subunit SMARCC1 isoform X2 [Ischnura elegans]